MESNLVHLGRLHDRSHADFSLVFDSKKSGAATFYSNAAYCDISADDLAGALELLFLGGLYHRASKPAYADQIARRGLDRVCVIDVTGPSILGRAALA